MHFIEGGSVMPANWQALVHMVDEIKRCDENNITTASMAMSYICIDALANLSRPIEKPKVTRKDFIDWVNIYLTAHPDQPYKYRGKDVYAARCALLHKFSAEAELHESDPDTIKFAYHDGGKHYFDPKVDSRLVLIGAKSFTNDLVIGVGKFMDACGADPDLMRLVESRLDKVFNKVPVPREETDNA
jgi:hypothetical protein